MSNLFIVLGSAQGTERSFNGLRMAHAPGRTTPRISA